MEGDPIKEVLRMMPYGFYAITSKAGEDVNIMVANWVVQSSFEPRLITFALQKTSYSYGLIQSGKAFAINLFRIEDAEAIKPFTKSRKKNPDKVAAADYSSGPITGAPILAEAAAYLEVKVNQVIDIGGDHDLVVGEVVGAGVRKPAEAAEILKLVDLGWNYAG
jgi:flavin reductase (DIM6/NTAB) family NADH-FMN oxidoreductase RutF